MKKQLYLLAIVLMFFLGFYSVYYYANYRVKNIPIRSDVNALDSTHFTHSFKADSHMQGNVLYSPALALAWQQFQKQKRDTVKSSLFNNHIPGINPDSVPNANLVTFAGEFTDTTTTHIKKLESRYFQNNFSFTPQIQEGQSLLYGHFYLKHIFKHFKPGLNFKGKPVKAIEHVPSYKDRRNYNLAFYQGSAIKKALVVTTKAGNKLIYATPDNKQLPLYQAFESVENALNKNNRDTLLNTDQLVIPVIDFQLTKRLPNLPHKGNEPITALQKVTFTTNAEFNVLKFGEAQNKIKRNLWFDEPFVVYYLRKGASGPYFLAWIRTPELLLNNDRSGS